MIVVMFTLERQLNTSMDWAPGCFKRLQLVSIGPNWSRSAVSFGSNKVGRGEGQMVHFGHTEGVDGVV